MKLYKLLLRLLYKNFDFIIDKLKFGNIFSKSCFIIKYIFYKDNRYFFNNINNLLLFFFLEYLNNIK